MSSRLVIGVLVLVLTLTAPSAWGQPTSCFVSSVPSPAGPAAPTDLTASLAATHDGYAVDLAWTDNGTGETCYVIERALGGNMPRNYTVLVTLAQGSTAYHDPGPYGYPSEAIAFYRIYATTETARSDYSNEAYTTFPPRQSPTPTPKPSGAILNGDANCDGVVDAKDVIAALSESSGVHPGAQCAARADVDCDTDVDGEDALRIVAHIGGVSMTPPAGCGQIGEAA